MSAESLAYRRRVAALLPTRLMRCPRCGMPPGSGNLRRETVWYSPRFGVSVLCRWCWPQTTFEERVRYFAGLVFGVWAIAGVGQADCDRDWPVIVEAVARHRMHPW